MAARARYAGWALMIGIGSLGSPVPEDAAPIVGATAAAVELRLMSFNIRYGTADDGPNRWEVRAPLVLDLIGDEAADVVGLQEALRFQVDAILEARPEYRFVGVGRDDGKDSGEFSGLLYRPDRLELVDSGTFWLSDTPEVPGSMSWGNRLPRICTWGRFRAGESAVFDVYNAHLDHQSAPSRLRSVELIWKRIRDRSEAVPFVVMGDFNAGGRSEPMQFLLGRRDGPTGTPPPAPGLLDPFRARHRDATDVGTFHGFTGKAGVEKIDHILADPGRFVPVEAEILRRNDAGRHPSDHYPVTARLRLQTDR